MQRKRRNTCAMALKTLVQIHEHNDMHMINEWMMMARPPWPFAYCLSANFFQIPFWLWPNFSLTQYSPCFHIFQLTKHLQVFRSSRRVPQPGSSKLDTQRLCNVDQQAIQHRKYSGWKTAFVWTCRTLDTHWSTVSFTLLLLQLQIWTTSNMFFERYHFHEFLNSDGMRSPSRASTHNTFQHHIAVLSFHVLTAPFNSTFCDRLKHTYFPHVRGRAHCIVVTYISAYLRNEANNNIYWMYKSFTFRSSITLFYGRKIVFIRNRCMGTSTVNTYP